MIVFTPLEIFKRHIIYRYLFPRKMARPLARDGNESNRIGSNMLKRCARNIARRGRGPSLPINDMKRKRRRAAAIFRIEVLKIRVYIYIYIYIISYHPNKKKPVITHYTLLAVDQKNPQKKNLTTVTCQWHTLKLKHPSHRDPPSRRVMFLCVQGDFLASPEFSACGLGGFRCWDQFFRGHKSMGHRWSLEKMEVFFNMS